MLEISTRKIEGTGCTVSLSLTNLGHGLQPVVIVTQADGAVHSRHEYASGSEALAHYQHTFAYADGPTFPADAPAYSEPPADTDAVIERAAGGGV